MTPKAQSEVEGRGEWQSIETAPLDGSAVLVVMDGEVAFAWYDDGCDDKGVQCDEPGWMWFDQYDTGDCEPTHWMPLPKAPT